MRSFAFDWRDIFMILSVTVWTRALSTSSGGSYWYGGDETSTSSAIDDISAIVVVTSPPNPTTKDSRATSASDKDPLIMEAPTATAPEWWDEYFMIEPGHGCLRNDIGGFDVDLTECATMCLLNLACKALEWNPLGGGGHRCWLKNSDACTEMPNKDITMYFVVDRPPPTTVGPTTAAPTAMQTSPEWWHQFFMIEPGYGCLGHDIGGFDVDLTECAERCLWNLACKALEWNPLGVAGHKCWLKNSDACTRLDSKQSTMYFVVDRPPHTTAGPTDAPTTMQTASEWWHQFFQIEKGYGCLGNDIGGSAVELTECAMRCLWDPSCKALEWNPLGGGGHRCWLKNTDACTRLDSKQSTMYFVFDRPPPTTAGPTAAPTTMQTAPEWWHQFFLIEPGYGCLGNDIGGFDVDLTECAMRCLWDPACKGLEWDPMGGGGHKCWLKNTDACTRLDSKQSTMYFVFDRPPPTTAGPTDAPTTMQTAEATTSADATTAAAAAVTQPPPVVVTRPPGPSGIALWVVSVLAPPFLQEVAKDGGSDKATSAPNATTPPADSEPEVEGFIKDVMDKIAKILNREFIIHIVKDKKYGEYVNGQWDGMIGEVVRKEADIAAAPLLVTVDRDKVVDFSYPLMRFEATIVMLKRHPEQKPVIASLQDLINQDSVKYGVVKDGAIHKFLAASAVEDHQKMLKHLGTHRGGLMEDANKGVQRVRANNDYAFILEGWAADWLVRAEPCELERIGAGFFRRQYAFAVPNLSPMRDQINEALVEMDLKNTLETLTNKWFKDGCSGATKGVLSMLVFLSSAIVALISIL